MTLRPTASSRAYPNSRSAAALNDRTGGDDPRVLDTLALALDQTGHRADARAALDVAIDLARTSGDAALVATLTARRNALGR